MNALWIRGVCYVALAAVLAQVSMLEAQHFSPLDRFSEMGYVEVGQAGLLAIMVLALGLAAWRRPEPAPLMQLAALVFAMLLVRENDQTLELWFPHGFWKWPALTLFAWAVVVAVRRWAQVKTQLMTLSQTRAFGVLLAGCTALVFSRLFGRGDLWEAIMEERYWRPVKNAAEEGVELFALGLLAAGVTEWILAGRRNDD